MKRIKICIVGEKAVGKTSLLNRYVFGTFEKVSEIEASAKMSLVSKRIIEVGGKSMDVDIALFDSMGETVSRDSFKEVLFWGAHGFLAVADVTRSDTLRALPSWVKVVRSIAGEIPFHLLMNKADLIESGKMNPDDVGWMLSHFPKTPYHVVSAKSSIGVEDGFDSLIAAIMERNIARSAAKKGTKDVAGKVGIKILSLAKRRNPMGVPKKDLLLLIREVEYDTLMAEIENLRKNGLLKLELTGPGSFVLKITEKGEKQLELTAKH